MHGVELFGALAHGTYNKPVTTDIESGKSLHIPTLLKIRNNSFHTYIKAKVTARKKPQVTMKGQMIQNINLK
jgi:hypothetical protein